MTLHLDIGDVYAAVASIAILGGCFIGAMKYVIRSEIAPVKREVLPNGGSSMKDQLNAIDKRLVRVETLVDPALENPK